MAGAGIARTGAASVQGKQKNVLTNEKTQFFFQPNHEVSCQ